MSEKDLIVARLREMNKDKKPENFFELLGELIGALICLAVILAVPIIVVGACAKYLLS